jgi:hypothetical protein
MRYLVSNADRLDFVSFIEDIKERRIAHVVFNDCQVL